MPCSLCEIHRYRVSPGIQMSPHRYGHRWGWCDEVWGCGRSSREVCASWHLESRSDSPRGYLVYRYSHHQESRSVWVLAWARGTSETASHLTPIMLLTRLWEIFLYQWSGQMVEWIRLYDVSRWSPTLGRYEHSSPYPVRIVESRYDAVSERGDDG